MNYLAHLFLAEPTDHGRIGALMGDFVKGVISTDFPREIAQGIQLHRRIDSYTDAHPVHTRSRRRIAPPRRRFAGIMVDIVYDHFLAKNWHLYSVRPLEEFALEIYEILAEHAPLLPEPLRRIVPRMTEGNWLCGYRDFEAVGRAIDGVSHRLSRPNALAGGALDLGECYDALADDFDQFFPRLAQQCEGLRERFAQEGIGECAEERHEDGLGIARGGPS